MYKTSNITDFFKPFSHPQQKKRHLADDGIGDPQHLRRSRSVTPEIGVSTTIPSEIIVSTRQKPLPTDSAKAGGILDGKLPSIKNDSTGQASKERQAEFQSRMEPSDPHGHVFPGSQRVVKDGRVMIRNSDDESESEVSLDDIDDLLVARRHTMASSPPTEPDLPYLPSMKQKETVKIIDSGGRTRNSTRMEIARLSSGLPVLPTYKFSLEALEKRVKNDKAAELGASKAKSLLDAFEQEKLVLVNRAQNESKNGKSFDAELVAAVMKDKGDEEGICRLMTAIERTEAFHQGNTWSFFGSTQDSHLLEEADFPVLDEIHWCGILDDSTSRHQAFLGGLIGDMASKKKLPPELLLWILDAVCLESREDLRYSYVRTLKEAQDQLALLFSPSCIDMLFRKSGASVEALNIKKPILPLRNLGRINDDTDRSIFFSVLELLAQTSPHWNTESQIHTLCLLLRLLLDNSIVKDCYAVMALDRLFTSIVGSVTRKDPKHEFHYVLKTIYTSTTDPALRLQLLKYIPTTSPPLSILRRRLALSFFLQDPSFLSRPLPNLTLLTHHLKTPQFLIRPETNYSDLAASISILSIAIDNSCPSPTEEGESTFNKDVDALSRQIYSIFTAIIDTGASHMMRTVAKEVLEALHSRLQFAVRTKPKPKTLLFGNSALDPELLSMRNGLQGFLRGDGQDSHD